MVWQVSVHSAEGTGVHIQQPINFLVLENLSLGEIRKKGNGRYAQLLTERSLKS